MVPKGEAIICSRKRSETPGWRAKNAARSWYPIDVGAKAAQNTLSQKGAKRDAPAVRIRNATITPYVLRFARDASPLKQTLPQWHQCDTSVYSRIKLANELTAAFRSGRVEGGDQLFTIGLKSGEAIAPFPA